MSIHQLTFKDTTTLLENGFSYFNVPITKYLLEESRTLAVEIGAGILFKCVFKTLGLCSVLCAVSVLTLTLWGHHIDFYLLIFV